MGIDRSDLFRKQHKPEVDVEGFKDREFFIRIECAEALDPNNSRFVDKELYMRLRNDFVSIVKSVYNKQGRDAAVLQYREFKEWFLMPDIHHLFYDDLKNAIS
jgi:hypothetical protein